MADMNQAFVAAIQKYGQIHESFQHESDRGCAVLVMCAVEEVVRGALEHRVGEIGKGMMRQLAPQGGWEPLLKSLRLVGILSNAEFADLEILRQVRNKFAHRAVKDLSFDHPEVASLLDQLGIHKAMWNIANRRSRFTMTASFIAGVVGARGFQASPMAPCPDLDFQSENQQII